MGGNIFVLPINLLNGTENHKLHLRLYSATVVIEAAREKQVFKCALNVRQENHQMTGQYIWNHCDQLLVAIAPIPYRGMSNQFLKNLKGNTLHWKFIVFIILM